MYRAVKNTNGSIIAIYNDQGQSGDYNGIGTWCSWTFSSLPDTSALLYENNQMLFKENATQDGITLRSDTEIQSQPNG